MNKGVHRPSSVQHFLSHTRKKHYTDNVTIHYNYITLIEIFVSKFNFVFPSGLQTGQQLEQHYLS